MWMVQQHRMLSRQTWSVFSVPRSRWCRRSLGGDELGPDWLASLFTASLIMYDLVWLICAIYTSELFCTGYDNQCRSTSAWLTWSRGNRPRTSRAAAFWTRWTRYSGATVDHRSPASSELVQSTEDHSHN